MTEAPKADRPQWQDQKPEQDHVLVLLIRRSVFYVVGAVVVGSFLLSLFVRNPYTQSVKEGDNFYENGIDNSAVMRLAIFVGIPASFWAFKRWILPLFDKK